MSLSAFDPITPSSTSLQAIHLAPVRWGGHVYDESEPDTRRSPGNATAAIAARIVAEEDLVVDVYPDYAAYVGRTKRIIPFVL